MTEIYDAGYPTVPVGGGNPYYACQYCGRTDPEINGILGNHSEHCEYRIRREKEISQQLVYDSYPEKLREILERFGVMDDELYDALDELISTWPL